MNDYVRHISLTLKSVSFDNGRIDLDKKTNKTFFFYITKEHDEDEIKKLATSLILGGCRDFHFYGGYENQWDLLFDIVDIDIFPCSTCKTVAMTSSYDEYDEFVDEIAMSITMRALVPYCCYLIYDDFDKYLELEKSILEATNINN